MLVNRPLAASLLLCVALQACIASAPSWAVLCLSPDGHVAVESGPVRCCTFEDSGADPTPAPATALAPMESCCGPCVDFPLGSCTIAAVRGSGGSTQLQEPTQLIAAPVTARFSILHETTALVRAGARDALLFPRRPLPTILRC